MSGLATLRALSTLISSAVQDLEKVYNNASAPFPDLDEPFNPFNASEGVAREPGAVAASSVIVAAAGQLTALLRPPPLSLLSAALSMHLSSCLRAASTFNITEILREAGPQGLHARDIGAKASTSSDKIARILRLLASHHIYKELSPDVFTNNRLSSVLDKGKPSKECFYSASEKFQGTSGISAMIEHITDEAFKSSAYLTETLSDPSTALSDDLTASPFAKAFNTKEPMWAWFEQPENKVVEREFMASVSGLTMLFTGFKWNDLPKGAIVVDVGGGIGSSSLVIAKANPDLRIVNQDRAPVIELAKVYWSAELPGHLEAGKAEHQVHDFFAAQPIKNAHVFLLRSILHDHSDKACVQILHQLREAATSETKLVIVDQVVPYASPVDPSKTVPGDTRPAAPPPLLPNMGVAAAPVFWADLHMYTLLNGKERTINNFIEVFSQAGWKLTQVHHIPGSFTSQVIATPA
ncbi:O-methyltransferase [Punctularia strigosozonata HHB-11173 SS5]|uniref:O-methyltransferase n=1 Tax=Punctularia strigosozonata (strain HHB-11173) TaxID=741275 RepID=UPI0004416686|nr:O-methyltransferase [Punctularia strigosozonata HHB-11173 SS5]EIN06898.1 O-methyltransferase [Punctularia strigosozonata HHB-11173 SS5]